MKFKYNQLVYNTQNNTPDTRRFLGNEGEWAMTECYVEYNDSWLRDEILLEYLNPIPHKYKAGELVLLRDGRTFALPLPFFRFGRVRYGTHIWEEDIVCKFCVRK